MGTTLDQRYVLDTQIASGAIATVWRALDRATGVPVAVKRLRPEAAKDPQLVDAFLAEAEVLADLDHPGLVPITDFVSIDGEYALIMELVDGQDLRARLNARGALAPAEAVALAARVAETLAAVHDRGIVHGDVKPANILVPATGDRIRLVDFGVARRTRKPATHATPEYVAPEIVEGVPPSPASDVYALGIVLYEAFTGRGPYRGGSTKEVLRRHATCLPVRTPGMPDEVWQIIFHTVNHDARVRPGAAEVSVSLAALVPTLTGLSPAPAPANLVLHRRRENGATTAKALRGGKAIDYIALAHAPLPEEVTAVMSPLPPPIKPTPPAPAASTPPAAIAPAPTLVPEEATAAMAGVPTVGGAAVLCGVSPDTPNPPNDRPMWPTTPVPVVPADSTPTPPVGYPPVPPAPDYGRPVVPEYGAPVSGLPTSGAPSSGGPYSAPSSGGPYSAPPSSGGPYSAPPSSGGPYSNPPVSAQPGEGPVSGAPAWGPPPGTPGYPAQADPYQPFSSAPGAPGTAAAETVVQQPAPGTPMWPAPSTDAPMVADGRGGGGSGKVMILVVVAIVVVLGALGGAAWALGAFDTKPAPAPKPTTSQPAAPPPSGAPSAGGPSQPPASANPSTTPRPSSPSPAPPAPNNGGGGSAPAPSRSGSGGIGDPFPTGR